MNLNPRLPFEYPQSLNYGERLALLKLWSIQKELNLRDDKILYALHMHQVNYEIMNLNTSTRVPATGTSDS